LGRAKDIIVKPICSKDANRIIKSLHYSGKVVQNSQVHLGVFLNGNCGGALQFGPSLDKRKLIGLVNGTLWHEFIELNRMALADWLPRNGESRAISVAMKLLRRHYPHLKWVVSFADACQCGDGTIYRASGFVLTGIKRNTQLWKARTGEVFNDTSIRPGIGGERERERERERAHAIVSRTTVTKGKHVLNSGASSMSAFKEAGWRPIPGYQLRYIYFLNPAARGCLTVPVLPYSAIKDAGAAMYLGKPCVGSADSGTVDVQSAGGGASPTSTLSK
jgi:hypothetical protein